jgi:hypothetical protein
LIGCLQRLKKNINCQLLIIPNPAKDFTTINFNKPIGQATIEVIDISGKQVIYNTISDGINAFKLNTQRLVNGVYVLKVNTSTASYNERLLISK